MTDEYTKKARPGAPTGHHGHHENNNTGTGTRVRGLQISTMGREILWFNGEGEWSTIPTGTYISTSA